jgi:hypothetical protein
MWCMNEIIRSMNVSCVRKNRGFVSLYFLGFLLYISGVSAAVMQNDISRMKTIENLMKDTFYYQQEKEVMDQFKCSLACSSEDSRILEEQYEIHGSMAYIEIEGEYPELLTIYFVRETKHVIDYESIRYQ